MNIILCYADEPRFWTVGSYCKKLLAQQDDIQILTHCRIPEDTGVCEEQYNPGTDLILVIDCGTHYKLHHHKGKFPKKTKIAFWISDLHRDDWAKHRLQMIREWKFDHIFYAQKNFKEMVMKQGYKEQNCSWLPHAVDSDIFKPMPHITKRYDIGYVGYLNDKRKKTADVIREYMKFKQFNSVWAWTACRAINECKIGFNISVEQDINMRVFETLACGLPLLTNQVNNGLEDLFGEDLESKMLVYSSDEEMKEKAVRLLAGRELREILAKNGREHVLQYHTYRSRINTILGKMGFPLLKTYASI